MAIKTELPLVSPPERTASSSANESISSERSTQRTIFHRSES